MLANEFRKSSMAFASQKTINIQLSTALDKAKVENKVLSESITGES
jgi:hypothetical protein